MASDPVSPPSSPIVPPQTSNTSPPPEVATVTSRLAARLDLSSPKKDRASPSYSQTLAIASPKSGPAIHRTLPISQRSKSRLHSEEPPGYLVGKLLTSKEYCSRSLMSMVRKVWKLHGTLRITEEDDRYVFRFGHANDARRVLLGGPWKFDDAPFILMPFDGVSAVRDVPLDTIGFWVQVQGVHIKFRTHENLERVGNALGSFVMLDEQQLRDGSIRIRVNLSLHYPILLGGPVTMEEGVTLDLDFTYENMIGRCKRCGLLTHIGLPCEGVALPPIIKVSQKPQEYRPPPPPSLLLTVAAITQTETPKHRRVATSPPPGFADSPSTQLAEENSTTTSPNLALPKPAESPVQDSSNTYKRRAVKIVRREPVPKNSEKRALDSMDVDDVSPTLKKIKPALATGPSNLSVPAFELPDGLTLGNLFYMKQKKKLGRPRGSGNKNKLGVTGGQVKKSPQKNSPQKKAAAKTDSPVDDDPAPEFSAPVNGSEVSA